MRRELGIARCGLACCLCSENIHCGGCHSDRCPDKTRCVNRKCSEDKGLEACYLCGEAENCQKGLLAKVKPRGFTIFIRRYGVGELLDCLEKNERDGVVYHRSGVEGDYDAFSDVETLIGFIKSGRR